MANRQLVICHPLWQRGASKGQSSLLQSKDVVTNNQKSLVKLLGASFEKIGQDTES
jgi:hypothetical protein